MSVGGGAAMAAEAPSSFVKTTTVKTQTALSPTAIKAARAKLESAIASEKKVLVAQKAKWEAQRAINIKSLEDGRKDADTRYADSVAKGNSALATAKAQYQAVTAKWQAQSARIAKDKEATEKAYTQTLQYFTGKEAELKAKQGAELQYAKDQAGIDYINSKYAPLFQAIETQKKVALDKKNFVLAALQKEYDTGAARMTAAKSFYEQQVKSINAALDQAKWNHTYQLGSVDYYKAFFAKQDKLDVAKWDKTFADAEAKWKKDRAALEAKIKTGRL